MTHVEPDCGSNFLSRTDAIDWLADAQARATRIRLTHVNGLGRWINDTDARFCNLSLLNYAKVNDWIIYKWPFFPADMFCFHQHRNRYYADSGTHQRSYDGCRKFATLTHDFDRKGSGEAEKRRSGEAEKPPPCFALRNRHFAGIVKAACADVNSFSDFFFFSRGTNSFSFAPAFVTLVP